MKEIWKDIEGYEGLYQVSNFGNVKSLNRTLKDKNGRLKRYKGKKITGHANSNGYLRVPLSGKNYFIHRLVAKAFIENPDNLDVVNHKDFNPKNNLVDNLEWCTFDYNMKYSYANGRFDHLKEIRSANGKKVISIAVNSRKKKIEMYDLNGNYIKTFNSITIASKETNTDLTCIVRCCRGENHTAGGYKWRYKK